MDKKCPLIKVLNIFGKRWSLLILVELYKGKAKWKRYSHLKRNLLNITPKILSSRLKELEKEKLINKRIDASTFPIKSEYRLTKSGEEFIDHMKGMKEWGLKWKVKNEHCADITCKECDM